MQGGFINRYAPLSSNDMPLSKKRKKRAESDTSTPRSPHPQVDNDTNPITSKKFENFDMNEKMNCLFEIMSRQTPMLMKLDDINHRLYQNKAVYDVTEARLRLLEYKSLDMEARMLRTNLVITGIPERDSTDSAEAVKKFLREHLMIETAGVVSGYRVGRANVARGRPGPRAIIATFRDTRYVEDILSKTRLLKGKSYGVSRDYPREIREARKELWPAYKEARDKYGPRNAKLVYPAALVVHGETVKNLFPRWHEVLRESRNSNVEARTELRLRAIVDATMQASTSAHPQGTLYAQNDQDESDTESVHSTDSEMSITIGPKLPPGTQQNQQEQPEQTITQPGYLLEKHPIMKESAKQTSQPSDSDPIVKQPEESTRANPLDPAPKELELEDATSPQQQNSQQADPNNTGESVSNGSA